MQSAQETVRSHGVREIGILVRDIFVERMERGFDKLLGGLEKKDFNLGWYDAWKINWHGWDDRLTVKVKREDESSVIAIDNGTSGETFQLRGNRATLSAFQILEGKTVPDTLVGRIQEEDHSGIDEEWANIIDEVDRVGNLQ